MNRLNSVYNYTVAFLNAGFDDLVSTDHLSDFYLFLECMQGWFLLRRITIFFNVRICIIFLC